MEYRRLGRTGFEVGAVGLGTEYLIDLAREHVVGVVREAIERGVNYFDVFFAQGEFRDNMGAAFAGVREKVHLAAHLGAIDIDGQYTKTRDVKLAEEFFEDFLRRYKTDYADVVMLHNSDAKEDYDELVARGGLLDVARRLVKEGKARAVGLSSHTVSTARRGIESGEIDVVMFPINMAGNAVAGRREFLSECARRDVGVVAMKVYAGGKLLTDARHLDLEMWTSGGGEMAVERSGKVTAVECVSYALAQAGVTTVAPGCKDKEELAAALAWLDAGDEERSFAEALSDVRQFVEGECVYCNHCLPCPSRIDIAAVIRALETGSAEAYGRLHTRASECVECGACVERCPFGVDAMGKVKEAARRFEARPGG